MRRIELARSGDDYLISGDADRRLTARPGATDRIGHTADRPESEPVTFDVDQLENFVLVASAVTLLAILAVRVSSRAGLPSLLLYLAMGVALGEAGLGIAFEDAQLAHALGFVALAVILAEGGLTTNWPDVRPSMRLGVSLATVGVAVSISVVAVAAHYLLGIPWELAVLLGAVTSPTDAAAVFSVLRVVPLPRRLTGALEAESGLNDAPTVVLVTLISTGAVAEQSIFETAGIVVFELVVGVLIGLLCGFGGAWVMRRAALPSSGLYPLSVMTLCFLGYGGAAAVHGSGFAAVYVAALVLGNSELPHRAATRSFAEGVAWLAQIGLFVMLGLLLSPDEITCGDRRAGRGGRPRPDPGRPAAVGPRQRRRLAAAVAGAVVPLLGRAARCGADRADHHPARRGGRGLQPTLQPGLRHGGDLHPADRPDPAAGGQGAEGGAPFRATRPRGRGGAAGAGRRRPAAGDDQSGVPDARRRGG